MLYAGNNLEQGAPHLRAHYQAPAAHPADHPTAHVCVLERVATARNVALTPQNEAWRIAANWGVTA
jgi:hypothetical protein